MEGLAAVMCGGSGGPRPVEGYYGSYDTYLESYLVHDVQHCPYGYESADGGEERYV